MRLRAPDSQPRIASKAKFLSRYGISKTAFSRSGLDWEVLQRVYAHYSEGRPFLVASTQALVDTLQLCTLVQAVHYRVKEPEHLVEKIIRRALGERTLRVSVYNYLDAIDDLIGFRALHLFKDDWPSLNTFIARNFRVLGPPRAIVYPTDPEDVLMMFRENGCLIDTRQTGYRSVHYSVVVNCRTKDLIAELQIRTLFEQAWGEVSHQIEYPYLSSVPLLRRYTSVLSEFAGCADHLASAARIVAQIAETNRRNPKDRKRRIRALQTRLGQKLNNILNNSPSVHRLLLNPAEVSPEALRGYTRRRPK